MSQSLPFNQIQPNKVKAQFLFLITEKLGFLIYRNTLTFEPLLLYFGYPKTLPPNAFRSK